MQSRQQAGDMEESECSIAQSLTHSLDILNHLSHAIDTFILKKIAVPPLDVTRLLATTYS